MSRNATGHTPSTREATLPGDLTDCTIYLVGIKGTGMAALTEILVARGAHVAGSDVAERFYTDVLLENLGISWHEGFRDSNLTAADPRPELVIYSAAYDPETHPELLAAARLGVPAMQYTEALGALSRQQPSAGIAGVHGKTTTTAMVACIVQELGLPGTVLAGSALPDVGGRATLVAGREFFVAETCEYRRNFLSFSPDVLLVTSVEPDHLDYFRDGADVEAAFVEYADRLPAGGSLVYCADDSGAARVARAVAARRDDLRMLAYGTRADGAGALEVTRRLPGILELSIGGAAFELHIPGDHNALNAAGALLVMREVNARLAAPRSDDELTAAAQRAIAGFHGTRRRAEIVGEAGGVTVIDDYAHHPTAIVRTLEGFRSFYPGRRIVLDFMSHTYSRTLALLDDFAEALCRADVLVLHDIYASAREKNPGGIDGETLAVASHRAGVRSHRAGVRADHDGPVVHYVPGVLDALPLIERIIQPGDLFVTMGAGNNWQLGPRVLDYLRGDDAP